MRHHNNSLEHCPIPQEQLHAAALWYKGGYTCKAPGGYIREYNPFHPYGSRRGLVMQHRLVVERKIGRILSRSEVVHHLDGDRTNNHPDNLELMENQSHHIKHEHKEKRNARYLRDPGIVQRVLEAATNPLSTMSCLTDISPQTIRRICHDHGVAWLSKSKGDLLNEELVKQALLGRSTHQAAQILGVHPQSLYSNFDHLLSKRRSPGFYDDHKEEILRMSSYSEAARVFSTHRSVIRKAVKRWIAQDAKLAESANLSLS